MLRVEFHCHTTFSKDSLMTAQGILRSIKRKGIHKVAITDHNTLRGALLAKRLDPEAVLIGEEIMTQNGELLALFLQEKVPPHLTPIETIHRLREQGAYIWVAHPFDTRRKGHWDSSLLEEIVPLVDAIEVFNARSLAPGANQKAQAFAEKHHLLGMVGSDAHSSIELGKATMLLPDFHDAESLRQAMRAARTEVTHSAPWVHLLSRYAQMRTNLKTSTKEP